MCINCELPEDDIKCILNLDILEDLTYNEIMELVNGEDHGQEIH